MCIGRIKYFIIQAHFIAIYSFKIRKKTTVKALAIWKITTLCDTNIGFTYCLSCSTAALLQEHDREQHEEDDDHEQRDDDDDDDDHDDHDCAWNV